MRKAKKFICRALFLCSLIPQLSLAQEDANAILDEIRSAQAHISQPLSGRLRPENGDPIPFQLRLEGAEFDYKFTKPPETIKRQLSDTGSALTDQTSAGQQVLSGAGLS